METPERRRGASGLEVREVAGAPVITGYAAVYNSETVIYGLWREQIAPGAFADAFTASADVRALWNHDTGTVLGRTTAGTLKLMDDDRGLKYAITVNTDDPMAMSVAAKIKRGDVNGSSFGFRVIDEEVDQEPTKKGLLPLVTIKAVELYEVSPVTFPAYEETSVSMRRRSQFEGLAAIAKQIAIRDRIRTRIRIEQARG